MFCYWLVFFFSLVWWLKKLICIFVITGNQNFSLDCRLVPLPRVLWPCQHCAPSTMINHQVKLFQDLADFVKNGTGIRHPMLCSCRRTQSWGLRNLQPPQESENGPWLSKSSASSRLAHCAVSSTASTIVNVIVESLRVKAFSTTGIFLRLSLSWFNWLIMRHARRLQ